MTLLRIIFENKSLVNLFREELRCPFAYLLKQKEQRALGHLSMNFFIYSKRQITVKIYSVRNRLVHLLGHLSVNLLSLIFESKSLCMFILTNFIRIVIFEYGQR